MSDIMRPIPFDRLIGWVKQEYQAENSIFGVKKLYSHPASAGVSPIFREQVETPFGPAAGPHTQLAQNLIASYVAGSRFFELKTVQKMDGEELSACISKPCITAADECYNCEWSTELTVPEAFAEYVKGYFAIKLITKEYGLGDPDGFVFNMSVGYDLDGIKTPKIDAYIEGMKNAQDTPVWKECVDAALAMSFQTVDAAYIQSISPVVSQSITLSTLHGCPPQEIERIASYLITEKRLHTYIKCNPTLLGYEYARKTLDDLGYDYISFDDHHFKADLQFADAVPMLQRLQALADQGGLSFGVKLTNTFPVQVAAGELPSEEMYMSGRSLYPLSLSVAGMLSKAFDGKLRISYSGGADVHNIRELVDAGIWPVTLATTLLKPGGYDRLVQIAGCFADYNRSAFDGVDAARVEQMIAACKADAYYRKPIKPLPSRKLKARVPHIDCFTAPCRGGCPIEQDIPSYLRLAGEGKHEEALKVITARNPLPFITGTICAHNCMEKCTRSFYESSVHIRSVKLEAAEGGYDTLLAGIKAPGAGGSVSVAVVGGGPAGISAAFLLARAGVKVTVFEKRETLGGIVRHVIPGFRISDDAIEKDAALAKAMGAKFECGVKIEKVSELFERGFTHVILANGAWKPGKLSLEYGETMKVLSFLEQFKQKPEQLKLGENVVIIGGGNTAMDAARAAKRVPGVKHVRLVYRRDKRNMPADEEELQLALEDGVEFCPLLAPVGVQGGVLTCKKMMLGAPDASGRRSPVDTGETANVPADTVITAVGEKIEAEFFQANGIAMDAGGRVQVNPETLETSVSNVYVAGDANRGPATVVEAIADATTAAKAIISLHVDGYTESNLNPSYADVLAKKGVLCTKSGCKESGRCLECSTVCECCVDVCPNRANVAVSVPGKRMRQIIHVDGMCNECGNCLIFCPYDSAPYKEKFTLFWNLSDFENSENDGFVFTDFADYICKVRLGGRVDSYAVKDASCGLDEQLRALILAVRDNGAYMFV